MYDAEMANERVYDNVCITGKRGNEYVSVEGSFRCMEDALQLMYAFLIGWTYHPNTVVEGFDSFVRDRLGREEDDV